jgi:hypothetical protein
MTTVDSDRSDRVHEPLTDEFLGVELSVDDPFPIYAALRARDGLPRNSDQG